jgi:hypothetical protein
LGHVGRISHFFQHGWRQPGGWDCCDGGRGGVIRTDVFLVAGSTILKPHLRGEEHGNWVTHQLPSTLPTELKMNATSITRQRISFLNSFVDRRKMV